MDINYELYKVFYHVARTLSFSEAAGELFISQSAVSQSIKVLEKRLDVTLFTRSTKRVSLTKEGEILFKHIEPAIHLICRGEDQLCSCTGSKSAQLRIAASDTICRYYLLPYLSRFHRLYPQIHLRVLNGTSLRCAELLEAGKADLIVANSPNPALTNGMKLTEVRRFCDVFVANPQYFAPADKKLSLNDLQKLPILMLGKPSTTSTFLHNLFLEHSLELAPAVELSSNDLLIDFARIGLGIAFVPDFCIAGENSAGLTILETEQPLPERKLIAACDGTLPLPESAKHFLDLLEEDVK